MSFITAFHVRCIDFTDHSNDVYDFQWFSLLYLHHFGVIVCKLKFAALLTVTLCFTKSCFAWQLVAVTLSIVVSRMSQILLHYTGAYKYMNFATYTVLNEYRLCVYVCVCAYMHGKCLLPLICLGIIHTLAAMDWDMRCIWCLSVCTTCLALM